jgi:flagellar biosynthesis/type III secretory pathway chaperone
MTAKEIQLKKVEVQLKVWSHRIDRLQAKAKTLQAIENRNGYQGQLNELAQKQVELAQKFQTLQSLNGHNPEALNSDIERTLTMIGESYNRTKEKLVQASCLGWTEGMAQQRTLDSEGWVQGLGRRTGHSEGWAEGMGYQAEDSRGWAEGMTA